MNHIINELNNKNIMIMTRMNVSIGNVPFTRFKLPSINQDQSGTIASDLSKNYLK